MLDMTGQIGVVAPGAYADIVAVNGDPLRDINVLGEVTVCDEGWRGVHCKVVAGGMAGSL